MKLTSEMIKQKAKELGIDVVGIANVDRYKNAPPMMSPLSNFPDCKSEIKK